MFTLAAAWMTAAQVAVQSALPDAYVSIGPLVTTDDLGGADLVIIGHDASADPPTSFTFEGQWRDTGANATTDGEIRVPITIYSTSGTTDLDMAGRIAAAGTLHASVRGALMPTPAGSALGVSGVMWAHEGDIVAALIPQVPGPVVRLVCTYTLATIV